MSGEQPRKKLKCEEEPSSSSPAHETEKPSAFVRPFVQHRVLTECETAAIHEAASSGNVVALIELLDQGIDLDIRDSDNDTPLHCAVEYNRQKVVKILLERGASISLPGRTSDTPLHIASYFGRVNILRRLIAAGANLNAVNYKGQTPLILACSNGHFECMKQLLQSRADLLKVDRRGFTPLMCAAEHCGVNMGTFERRYLQIAKKLIAMGAEVNAVALQKQSALHIAALKGNLYMIRILCRAGADPYLVDTSKRTPLDIAGFYDRTQSVLQLLKFMPEGIVPIDSFEKAAGNVRMNFMKLLFKIFTPGAFHDCNALSVASKQGRVQTVKLLIEAGFDVNRYESFCGQYLTPLHFAAGQGNISCLQELLKAGADVDRRYSDEYSTALHEAAMHGHKECVEELLKCGAKHFLYNNKYPWQYTQNTEIRRLLQEHQNTQS